jgi:hypothetical protein
VAAVVVREGLCDGEEGDGARGVGDVRIAGGDAVARDDGVPRGVRVVHEEEPVLRVTRVEGEAEQASLAAAPHERRDVEERRRPDGTVLEDDDAAALKREKETRVARVSDGGRLREAGDERLERDLGDALGARAPRGRKKANCEKCREKTV